MRIPGSSKLWLVAALLAGIGLSPGWLAAQATGQITGTVTSATGAPLAGVSVGEPGTTLGATTASDGRYTISGVSPGTHTVHATLVGYAEAVQTVTVVAGRAATANFRMSTQAIQLDALVAVGYGTQKKATLTGSVAAVTGEEITQSPAANVSNSLAGKLPGVVTVNTSGEPGYDGSSIRIRGNHTLNNNSPLVVIDGVADRAGGLERLNPEDIESISVLKDASAAIYGARAANGVILVTTKRGTNGSPQLSIDFNQGFNQPTRLPKMADAATYMTMLNEIDMYRNQEPRYSQEEIDHYRNGDDPWLYPNTNWFDAVIKPMSLQRRGDVSLRGGADRIKYYVSLGGQTQDGYYENSATRYNQYSFRSNLDGQISKDLSIRFDLTGRLEDRNFPNRSAGSIFRSIMRGKPNLPAYWPNGMPGPDIEYGDNPVVIGTPATGFDRDQRYYVQGNVGADFKVPGVSGLTLRANAAYDQMFRYEKAWRTPWTLYTWDYKTYDSDSVPVLVPGQRGYSAPELSQADYRDNDVLLNFIAEYRRDFGEHTVGLLGGVERQTSDNSNLSAFRKFFISDQIDEIFAGGDAEKNNGGSAGLARRQNYFTRLNYDYADKYLLEFVGRYDGSYIFPKDNRFGFFPAVSAGWRISEEPFFQNHVSAINSLKLRGSWGQTGNDRIDEWQYLASYGFGGGYVLGGKEVKSIYQTRTPNPNVTWEVANQMDFGVDGEAFDNRFSFTLDWFREHRDNILWWRNASVPQSTGLSLPRENIGKVNSWGYDGSLTWRQELGSEATFNVMLNGGYAQNKILFWDEAPGAPDYQKSTGYRMSTGLYYKSMGVFKDQAAVDAYPHWSGARPGDIIFEDVNGDGKINSDDRVRINKNGDPTWTGGITFGANVKNFDATVFFQGAAGAVQYLETESGDIGNYLEEFADGRWTPDNPSSTKPRAYNRSDEYWISNNNTYFLRSTDYLRLKTVELGYRLPESLASRLGVKRPRIYVSGFNVLTWDKFGLMDPESRNSSGQYYPQARVFNVGASVTF